MSIQIKNSVCFVTGSSRGIGRAIVEELIAQGAAKVYASARNTDALKELADSSQGKVTPVTLDVTQEKQIKEAAQKAGDTQILINNAGLLSYSGITAASDLQSARQEMEINYFGLVNMIRAFAPILKENGGGAIVNISSIGGLIGIPLLGTYCATKAAVHSLTQSARGELKAQGTFLQCVYPGPIDTDMTQEIDMEKETPQNVAMAIFKGLESGAEEVFPDEFAKDFAQKLKSDQKALELEWSTMLPQPAEA